MNYSEYSILSLTNNINKAYQPQEQVKKDSEYLSTPKNNYELLASKTL